ncbi:MAG: winged helix-turn-helix transcriptional regulator [Candidatus Cyclonatronum sp.]|uniref:GbsR/MarR family transcriptional regulator n=1 Tax=Cyclonatronum sp. TaxID=3024185 RepID=UPI0025C0B9B6|nr:winged helix-turn-helix transcriptional regulator [Cyclonatronum sp.]MCH8486759.1 winged helix-turn-helix transcriptional regulator [Cyclonatronum sp.]
MMNKEQLIDQLVNAYAEAYQNLGYSSLMGKIVALLIATPGPLSLDEISDRLQMSKGPVSQIARKLKDHQLIEKVWVKGERKDYYQAVPDIFGQAFANYAASMRRNKQLGEKFQEFSENLPEQDEQTEHLASRMAEMKHFYELMAHHNKAFLQHWKETVKPELIENGSL